MGLLSKNPIQTKSITAGVLNLIGDIFTQVITRLSKGPKSQVPVPLRSIYAISAVESVEVGTYHFTHGFKYDMDAYMAPHV